MNDELKEIIEKEKRQGQGIFGQDIRKNVHLEYAGPLQRLFASGFDWVVASVIFTLIAGEPRVETTTREILGQQFSQSEVVYGISAWYSYLIWFLMRVVFEASPLQASPGKLLFFLKVSNREGEKLNIFEVLVREIFYFFPLSFITFFFNDEKQCIHDKVASSVVIKKNDLSNIIFFPALILSLAGNFFVSYWNSSQISNDVDMSTIQQMQEVPVFDKEEALKEAIIPEDDKLGSIKINGDEVELNTVFVRLKDLVKYTSFGELKKNGQELEIVFYEDQINSEKLKKLKTVSDLMNDSKTVVKNNPVAMISIKSDYFDSNCKNIVINDSELVLNLNRFDNSSKENRKIKLRFDELKLNNLIFMNCEAIKDGEELFFSMQTPFKLSENGNGVVNVRFTEKVRELKYLGGYVYRHSNPKLVLAVYNKEQQQMKIAFYREQFSKESLNTAYVKGILPTTPKPDCVLDIPVNSQLYGSGKDIVNKGYTMTFKNLPDEIGNGLAHHDYQIKFEAGEAPARFIVQSPHAPQIQGRFEGLKEIASSEGVSNLAWNISFNARLILIKR